MKAMKATNVQLAVFGVVIVVVASTFAGCERVPETPPAAPTEIVEEEAPAPAEVREEEVPELPVILEEGPPPTPIPRTWSLEEYQDMVEEALPELDPGMLKAPEGEDWLSDLSIEQVAAAVDDLPPPEQVYESPIGLEARDEDDTRVIKIDTSQGRVRYLSEPRSFDWSRSPHKAVPEETAKELTLQSLEVLEIPAEEQGELRIDTVMGQEYDVTGESEPEPPFERERLTTVPRQINGYEVFENYARIAVSNEAEIARLLTIWPQFRLAKDLELRSRNEIVDTATNYMFEAVQGAAVEVEIGLAYVRAGYDFIPAAIVTFYDGLLSEIVVIPLVETPPDEDLDGVEDDEDNCVAEPNPEQLDEDQDGVGDECDNCLDVPNPKQEDENEDRIGDACEIEEKEEKEE